ncbi:AI-2E family transporter [Pseudomonadales bacterium]|nr:AI-2E family transporter [Pseudomonadales bacterium]
MSNQLEQHAPRGSGQIIFLLAALIIIAAGLKSAQEIMVPFLLAAFIATIAATPMFWIRSKGVPAGVALALVVVGIFTALLLIGAVATQSTSAFIAKLPFYQERLISIQGDLVVALEGFGIPVDLSKLLEGFSLSSALKFAGSTLASLGNLLSNGFLIILTVIFILAEATSFYPKLNSVLSNPQRDLVYFTRFANNMNRYVALKTSMSLLTGLLVSVALWILDIDFPILWGLLAFLLNFIPTIGSIFAAIPPLLLALIQHSPSAAGAVALVFFLINMGVGNVLEPRYMGKGLDLSTLVVFLSLIFWGWILSTVGMFLSVPLTMTGKIAMEANPRTVWLARLLGQGADSELPPAATIEQDTAPTTTQNQTQSPPLNQSPSQHESDN